MKDRILICAKTLHFGVLSAALFLSASAHADVQTTARCLIGQERTTFCKIMLDNYWQHEALISRAAIAEGIEPNLLKAVVAVESQYNAQAVSPVGARGLGQVMPSTGVSLGVDSRSLSNPAVNLAASARYLADQWRSFGDWRLALAAYNAGPGRVTAYRGIPPFAETQHYVNDVLWLYNGFRTNGKSLATSVQAPKYQTSSSARAAGARLPNGDQNQLVAWEESQQ